MCKKSLDRCPLMFKYCLHRYKARNICKTFADAYPLVLRYISDWFVTPKMLEVLDSNELDFNDLYKLFTWCNKYNSP